MPNLFRKAEPKIAGDDHPLLLKAADLQEKTDMLQRSVTAMLHFLKAFAMDDIQELQTERYKTTIDELSTKFQQESKPKHVELHFENQKEKILAFIESQHVYVQDREKELRDIIDLLTKAMANLNIENREFYQRIYDQSEKIIEISLLDDIKKIKNALKQEVDQMRETVDLKQDQEKRQIQQLAGQVTTLQKELEKAKAKSLTDGLTGVYNRQAFDEFIKDKIERSNVMNEDFCLLLLDLDDFKLINDKHGHLIGDRVLMACAQKCRGTIRGDDFMARYGGEEFAIFLVGANLRNALNKASQICKTIASARYATSQSQTEDYLSITVSIGVTPFKKGDSVESLIARADKALYDAKRKGKNMAIGKKP